MLTPWLQRRSGLQDSRRPWTSRRAGLAWSRRPRDGRALHPLILHRRQLISLVSMRHLRSFGETTTTVYVRTMVDGGRASHRSWPGQGRERRLFSRTDEFQPFISNNARPGISAIKAGLRIWGRRTRRCSRMYAATATFTRFRTTALAWFWTSVLVTYQQHSVETKEPVARTRDAGRSMRK